MSCSSEDLKCPVNEDNTGCPVKGSNAECPVDKSHPLINPLNNMEYADQTSTSGSTLSKEREVSSIPMANSKQNWIYPSEQMFFNAMKRKNWNPDERDMNSIIPIHNAVNERCWREILKWEAMHKSVCSTPKLLKFQGRPKDYTPKARFRQLLG